MERILFIGNDGGMNKQIGEILAQAGYETVNARDVEEGILRLRFERFHLVIAGILIPVIKGLETVAKIHHEFPGLKIIAVPGGKVHVSRFFLGVAKALGVDHTLSAAHEPAEIAAAVRTFAKTNVETKKITKKITKINEGGINNGTNTCHRRRCPGAWNSAGGPGNERIPGGGSRKWKSGDETP